MIDRVGGTIRRRMLVNFRIDPGVAQARLPVKFRPKLANGYALGGVCLIRLEQERPLPLPAVVGLSSENAAHRFAALRADDRGTVEDCVYIAHRHSGSALIRALGGRVFPGAHEGARFSVQERDGLIDLTMSSRDGFFVQVRARRAQQLAAGSVFTSIDEASRFFLGGSLGYSGSWRPSRLDALRLETSRWAVVPLDVDVARSTYFEDRSLFPTGSIEFDSALLMEDIPHEWRRLPQLVI